MNSLQCWKAKLKRALFSMFQYCKITVCTRGEKVMDNLMEKIRYSKVASSNMPHLVAHAGFFRLLKKGIFDSYAL
jgi:hypothetical protein